MKIGNLWMGILCLVGTIVFAEEPTASKEKPKGDSWSRTLKDRSKRGTLRDAFQRIRGDSGKWNDEPRLQHAPSLKQKSSKMSLDDWADQLQEKPFHVNGKEENWLLFKTRQLDDNDRVWIERIERQGKQFTIVLNQAIWQGRYQKTFTYYNVYGVNLGKLPPGQYEAKWIIKPLTFREFEGNGRPRDQRTENWSKNEQPTDKKPTELSIKFSVDEPPNVELFSWERGIGVRARANPKMAMYLWFYEWNLFEAMKPGQHTAGQFPLPREVQPSGNHAIIHSPELNLKMTAVSDGIDLLLTVRNRTDRDWPKIAGIIPCFNPGPANDRTQAFDNTKTYFLGSNGLERLNKREIHFNSQVRALVDAESKDGEFVFSHKWPTAEPNATAGILIRESTDSQWVTGIVWEEFLSAQSHNPWDCMHLAVRVGPLQAGESKQIRGKIYLFPGNKEECLRRIRRDFETVKSKWKS